MRKGGGQDGKEREGVNMGIEKVYSRTRYSILYAR